MYRRRTSSHLVRQGPGLMRLLPVGLTWSESARGRCCRSFGLARCVLQAGARGAACPASTHQRAVQLPEALLEIRGEPVCVKVSFRVRLAHGRAAGPAEPAPSPEHTRHFKPATSRCRWPYYPTCRTPFERLLNGVPLLHFDRTSSELCAVPEAHPAG